MTHESPTADALNLALLGQLRDAYLAYKDDYNEKLTLSLPELAKATGAKAELVKKRLAALRLLHLIKIVEHQPKGYQWEPFAQKQRHWLSDDEATEQAYLLAALDEWQPTDAIPLAKKWRR